jgi:alpha-ketoglutarate-dependent taurine dioxygenase
MVTFAPQEWEHSADLDGAELQRALRDHIRAAGLVLIRDVELDAERFVQIVEALDPVTLPWDATDTAPGDPRVQVMRVEAVSGGRRTSSAQHWHSDQSFAARPPGFTALYCVEAPHAGGGTQFCGMRLGGIAPSLLAALDGTRAWIRHSFRDSLGVLLRGRRSPERLAVLDDRYPDVWHPLIREQPATGNPAMFLSPLTARTLRTGDSETEISASEPYARILAAATSRANTYLHRWRPGDLLVWDNSVAMHRREPGAMEGGRAHWRVVTRGLEVKAAGGPAVP